MPKEVWFEKPIKCDHLCVFCCVAYVHVRQGKLESRALKCMFLGHSSGVKGCKLWYDNSNKCITSRDVTFKENDLYMCGASDEIND